MEGNGVVRRLCLADGARLRAPRPHVARDPRGAVDRLPTARAPRRPREDGRAVRPHLAGSRSGGGRAGLGGGRVLDRAVVAGRFGRWGWGSGGFWSAGLGGGKRSPRGECTP